jgi:hypothetical protein
MTEEMKFNEVTDTTEQLSNSINNDKQNNTWYGETVLTSKECISRLPDIILDLLHDYERGLLPTTSKEEVNQLLSAWFNNESNSQQSTDSSESLFGQPTSQLLKRRRFDSNF